MPPEVHRAIERASEHYVEIAEWQRAAGARLASFAAAGSAMVCSGSAACIAASDGGLHRHNRTVVGDAAAPGDIGQPNRTAAAFFNEPLI